ncbi:MAG: hypothetical protein OHK006_11300 [Thermodesulfovibrionales bacterium]
MLMEAGIINNLQLGAALAHQREWGGRLGTILAKRGLITQQDIVSVIEKQAGIPCLRYDHMKKPSPELMRLVKLDIARKFCIFPVSLEGRSLTVATVDPTDLKTLDQIGFHLNVRVKPVLACEEDIEDALDVHYENAPFPPRRTQSEKNKAAKSTPLSDSGFEIIRSHQDLQPVVQQKPQAEAQQQTQPPQQPQAKAASSSILLLDSLISLLIEKGIITREELLKRLQSGKKP